MENKHLALAKIFIALAEQVNIKDESLNVGDILIAMATAMGFFVHFRSNESTIDEVVGNLEKLIRHQAENADKLLGHEKPH